MPDYVFYQHNKKTLINVSGMAQNVDTGHISELLTDNAFHVVLHISLQYPCHTIPARKQVKQVKQEGLMCTANTNTDKHCTLLAYK